MSSQELGLSREQPTGRGQARWLQQGWDGSRGGHGGREGVRWLCWWSPALGTWWELCPVRGGAGLGKGAPAHPQQLMACSGNDWQVQCFLCQNCSWWLRLGISESSAGTGHLCVPSPAHRQPFAVLQYRSVGVSQGPPGLAGKSCIHVLAAVVAHVGLLCHAIPSLHPVGHRPAPQAPSSCEHGSSSAGSQG